MEDRMIVARSRCARHRTNCEHGQTSNSPAWLRTVTVEFVCAVVQLNAVSTVVYSIYTKHRYLTSQHNTFVQLVKQTRSQDSRPYYLTADIYSNQRLLLNIISSSVALLVARRTNDRKVAGSRPTKVVCITVLTGNRIR